MKTLEERIMQELNGDALGILEVWEDYYTQEGTTAGYERLVNETLDFLVTMIESGDLDFDDVKYFTADDMTYAISNVNYQ